MKHFTLTILGFFLTVSLLAQVGSPLNGNEWIQYNQQYFKIPVGKDGVYRLNYADLVAAGFPSSVQPGNVQLFHRGIEQAIFVEDHQDGQFNLSDYIDFYGRRNDGTLDTELYKTVASQPHTLYNLYNDTTSYFLTIGSSQGKRMPFISQSNTGLTPDAYHWDEKIQISKDQFSAGVDYGEIYQSIFDDGEGWMSNQITTDPSTYQNYSFSGIINAVTTGSNPILEIAITGRGPMNHAVEIYAGGRLISTVNFSGFVTNHFSTTFLWSDISSNALTISVKVVGVGGQPDRVSVGYVKIKYPQEINAASATEKIFNIPENPLNKSLIQIQNPVGGMRVFDITDPSSVSRVDVTLNTTLDGVLPSSLVSRKILATSLVTIPSIKRVSFRQIDPIAHNYVIITHPLLRQPAAGYTDPVKAYAEYRAQAEGGGYDTLTVNIQQLYDQFSYGEQTPVAIFHFVKFLAATHPPDYLFLIGKGLDVNNGYYRNPNAFTTYKDLVPTSGIPGSDMAFSAGLSGTPNAPAIATGRLTASHSSEVAGYLNKVREKESLPFDDLKRKNILHLSGGINPGEPQIFRSFLEGYAAIAESYHLGGNVKAIAKQSTDLEVINVASEVNKGLALITFFGHSAPNSSDFDIGYVTDPVLGYNNKDGKYPFIIMNGCLAGSFFTNGSIFGENWVNTSGKGAVGLIAHTSFGFQFTLHAYSDLMYNVGFADPVYINKGIGDVQREVAKRFLTAFGNDPSFITQVQQMVLLGDPAVKLFGALKPDYEIEQDHVSLESYDAEPITALSKSFKINMVVQNFGNAVQTDFRVEVERTLNDNSIKIYDSVYSAVLYSDTLTFIIPGEKNGFGNNKFKIKIDADNAIDELSEENNEITLEYFIPLSGTKNLYPNKYAIVNTTDLKISFQQTDLLSAERDFLLEVDTLKSFTSGYKQQYKIKGTVLATHALNLLTKDTLAYYWRTRLADPLPNESTEWDVSSFTYINNGPEGWAQVDFSQYENDPSITLVKDPQLKRIKFEETITDIAIKTFGAAANKPVDSVSFKIDGAEYNLYSDAGGVFGCRDNTINLIAFDKKTTQPYPGIFLAWYEINNDFGGRKIICGREPYVINSFASDELTMFPNGDINKYVNNVAAGDSVILFNIGDAGYANWPLAAKTKLGELGISIAQIDQLDPGEGVVIFGKKGSAPGSAKVLRTSSVPSNEGRIKIEGTVTGRSQSGVLTSGLIGPAQRWENFLVHNTDIESSDEILFDIVGVKLNGEHMALQSGLSGDTDISDIDPALYPYVEVSFKPTDNLNLTPAQLDKWLVTFEPVAEGILLYQGTRDQLTLQEGEPLKANYNFINISTKSFSDSLTVNYEITNPSTFTSTKRITKVMAPAPGDTTKFDLSFETIAQLGLNNVEVFVNPHIQPEQNYDNNRIILTDHANVFTDYLNPVLDVTFDGRHLVKDEFVSKNPNISIALWDDNPYRLKKDTLGIKLLLAYPCTDDTCIFKAVYFSNTEVSWKAATDTSYFIIHYNPQSLPTGKYAFRVEGSDVKGNLSGVDLYEITFQVGDETGITISEPYPNPFTLKTYFSFNVEGDIAPDAFSLQILKLNGEVMMEFFEKDSQNFHVGINTISWSAVDVNGNQIPGGLYLYRMVIHIGNEELRKNGKLVLTR
jgi:hypothetical protein